MGKLVIAMYRLRPIQWHNIWSCKIIDVYTISGILSEKIMGWVVYTWTDVSCALKIISAKCCALRCWNRKTSVIVLTSYNMSMTGYGKNCVSQPQRKPKISGSKFFLLLCKTEPINEVTMWLLLTVTITQTISVVNWIKLNLYFTYFGQYSPDLMEVLFRNWTHNGASVLQ